MVTQTPIILLHGLHMNTLAMRPLANFLKNQGFSVHLFRYYSVKDSISTHSHRLTRFIHTLGLRKVHLIGHSLGGLVIRQFLHDNLNAITPISVDKVITLGTPHLGSICAHYAKRLSPILLGYSYGGSLDGSCPPLPAGITLGSIAGTKPNGIGKAVLSYHSKKIIQNQYDDDNDGTVYVFETKLDNASDHLVLPVSHSGMLFNKQVFERIITFLTVGQFNPDPLPAE